MFKWLRKTALWIIAIPALCFCLGYASNQAVLAANHDRFPVMWNEVKTVDYLESVNEAAQSGDPKAVGILEGFKHTGMLNDTHELMTSKTHLNFFADWIQDGDDTLSIGDELLSVAEYFWYFLITWAVVVVTKLSKKEE